jgi:glycosyltransferase involved in cell wall biosynthesis
MLSNKGCPLISIITPSYNQGDFIEETIQSVLSQNYPNLEYIIIDGGSTDNTVDIIKKYESQITYWVSEPDRGQSDAINKGLKLATGDIWAYINSDDIYQPETLHKVAEQFISDPNIHWVTGHAEYMDQSGQFVESLVPAPFTNFRDTLIRWESPRSVAIQVSNFMSVQILRKYGFLDESLHYCMDAEFGMRILADGITPIIIPEVLAKARLHSGSKTVSQRNSNLFLKEDLEIARRFLRKLSRQERSYVERKLAECEYFLELSKISEFHRTGEPSKFLNQTLSMLIQHPSYLFHRATWGMFRRVLGLAKASI